MIYLDNAATTYPKNEIVYKKMDWANRNLAFNSGRGSYSEALEATKVIDETRKLLIDIVKGTGSETVVLTSSATEALNIILQGIGWEQGDIVYISPYEHNAVARVLEKVKEEKGIKVELLPLKNESLEIDVDRAKYLITKFKPKCICCTHVSNVTGYILPIKDIFETAKMVDSITVLDASQSMGLVDIDSKIIHADFIAFAGHKTLYGPFGIGGFIDVNQKELKPFIVGGTGSDSLNLNMPSQSPYKYESASKNIISICGLNEALKVIDVEKNYNHEKTIMSYLINEMKKISSVSLYYSDAIEDNHIGILSFNISGYCSEDIGNILSEEFDIAVRTGYHCAPYIHDFLNDKTYLGTVRVSIGQFNTFEDINSLINAIKTI